MSAGELALCLHVREVTNPESSPYMSKYVSSLAEPHASNKAQTANPFLTPVQHIVKRSRELRPAPTLLAPRRSSSGLCYFNHQPRGSSQPICKDTGRVFANHSTTGSRPASRSGSSARASSTVLHPRPNSRPQDYKTLTIVNQLSESQDSASHVSAQTRAPYLLAPGGQYISQLTISRSPSRPNRVSLRSTDRKNSVIKAVPLADSSSESISTGTASCTSRTSRNTSVPLATLADEELDIRERELELELRQVKLVRDMRHHTRPTMQNVSADPLLTSITTLSRSSSRNIFLESYVAEEAVRRCLQSTGSTGSQLLTSNPGGDEYSSQASVLTAVHLDRGNADEQDSPRVVAAVLKKLVSELMQASRSPSPNPSVEVNECTAAPQSESSSPFPNTYSARDYVTHNDVLSVFDSDGSLNFSKFKCLAKKFYGRISKEKLWSVAKEIDTIEEFDCRIDYLYSFLFNR